VLPGIIWEETLLLHRDNLSWIVHKLFQKTLIK